MKAKNEVYAIRCFIDRKRAKTDTLTKPQARIFRQTARHLVRYLSKEYDLGSRRNG